LPVLGHDLSRLASVELVPFRAAARAGVASIMTAHVLWPALDPDHPATLSERVLAPLLAELSYDGLVVSDDLEMGAVAGRYSMEDAACRAVSAGCDALLVCKSIERQEAVVRGLYDGGRSGLVPREHLSRAFRKIDDLLNRVAHPRPPLFVVGCAEHRALAASIGGLVGFGRV
jgi:beta-N-acetylhexosaminidase